MMMRRRDLATLWSLLSRFLRPYWRSLAVAVLVSVVAGFILPLRALVLAPALESVVEKRVPPADRLSELTLNNIGPTLARSLRLDLTDPFRTAVYVSMLFVGLTALGAGLRFATQALLVGVRGSVHRDMLTALHGHLLTLPLAYFHKRRAGELVSRLTQDITGISRSLESLTRDLFQSVVQIAVVLAILFRTDALFTLSVLTVGSIHLLITRLFSRRIRELTKAVTDRRGDVGARLLETFVGIRAIKSFAAERYESKRLREVAEMFRRSWRRTRILTQVDIPLRMVADALVGAVVLVFMFYMVSQGRLTTQAAVIFFYLSLQLVTPLSRMFRQWLVVAETLGGASRVIEMFEMRSSIPDGTKPCGELREGIVLENVGFAYEEGRPVLSEINLEIRRDETVALVGLSGAGKSTLADLVLRLFDVGEGAIRFDGTNIREFMQRSYRRNFGVVAQESLLFNGTVRENVVYNRPEDPEALAHAVWAANAEEFVRELPQGLGTVIGDRGVRLSGGQRQRIAIARAVYGRPSILILDEATSALDSEAEREVQKAIERIGREMIVIVIAHRLSTIVHADRIVVLNRGRIEAVGPHEQVLESSPTYRRLYTLQVPAPLA